MLFVGGDGSIRIDRPENTMSITFYMLSHSGDMCCCYYYYYYYYYCNYYCNSCY